MSFAEGELASIFQFVVFLPLLFKIPVYASAFSRSKRNASIMLHQIFLVSVNAAFLCSLYATSTIPISLITIGISVMIIPGPVLVISMMRSYRIGKPVERYLIYFGILELLIWLAFMVLPIFTIYSG